MQYNPSPPFTLVLNGGLLTWKHVCYLSSDLLLSICFPLLNHLLNPIIHFLPSSCAPG